MIDGQVRLRRSWLSQLKRFGVFIVLCVACVVLSQNFPGSVITGRFITVGDTTIYLSIPLFSFLPLYALMMLIYPIYDALFTIDNRGLETRYGIISLQQKIVRIRYEDVRSIELQQSLLDRALNIGDVGIGSAATGKIEIVFDGVASPKEVQRMIQQERDRRLRARSKKGEQKVSAANE